MARLYPTFSTSWQLGAFEQTTFAKISRKFDNARYSIDSLDGETIILAKLHGIISGQLSPSEFVLLADIALASECVDFTRLQPSRIVTPQVSAALGLVMRDSPLCRFYIDALQVHLPDQASYMRAHYDQSLEAMRRIIRPGAGGISLAARRERGIETPDHRYPLS